MCSWLETIFQKFVLQTLPYVRHLKLHTWQFQLHAMSPSWQCQLHKNDNHTTMSTRWECQLHDNVSCTTMSTAQQCQPHGNVNSTTMSTTWQCQPHDNVNCTTMSTALQRQLQTLCKKHTILGPLLYMCLFMSVSMFVCTYIWEIAPYLVPSRVQVSEQFGTNELLYLSAKFMVTR